VGNTKSEGEMEEITAGSQLIVKVLLDKTDGHARFFFDDYCMEGTAVAHYKQKSTRRTDVSVVA
jgi:hypothetical protein